MKAMYPAAWRNRPRIESSPSSRPISVPSASLEVTLARSPTSAAVVPVLYKASASQTRSPSARTIASASSYQAIAAG